MKNVRGAGRRPVVTTEQVNTALQRYNAGESIASIALEYGVTRQALAYIIIQDCFLLYSFP